MEHKQPTWDVYFNGRMVPPDEACVPVNDAGIQHAVGLFETFRVHHGRAFRFEQHLRRLCDSAVQLGLAKSMKAGPLAQAMGRVIAHNKLEEARIRLTVTPGSLSLLKPEAGAATRPTPTLLIVPEPATVYDPAYFEWGITVVVAPPAANPFDATAGHKTLNYWQRLRTLRQAASLGAGEAIWLNVTNHLASGAISNLFLVRDGALLTPIARGEEAQGALAAPVLPGVTRATVIELAGAAGLAVERKMLSVEDMLDADEVFLTNSSWYVLPVTKVEKKAIGNGKIGPVTLDLRKKLLDLVERETRGDD